MRGPKNAFMAGFVQQRVELRVGRRVVDRLPEVAEPVGERSPTCRTGPGRPPSPPAAARPTRRAARAAHRTSGRRARVGSGRPRGWASKRSTIPGTTFSQSGRMGSWRLYSTSPGARPVEHGDRPAAIDGWVHRRVELLRRAVVATDVDDRRERPVARRGVEVTGGVALDDGAGPERGAATPLGTPSRWRRTPSSARVPSRSSRCQKNAWR